jgi:hypothetical protein
MALFLRTVTMDSRSWVAYALRLAMLGVLGLTLTQFLIAAAFNAQSSAPGLEFFRLIVGTNLFFISICGIVVFASAITEEKEVGSLGLLMMTGLTPLSTLLSKGASKLMVGVALILAQIPFSILSVTLGGVGRQQVLAAYAAIIAYVFLVGNVALFFSVVSARTPKAMSLTFIFLVFFNSIVPIYPATRFLSPGIRVADILSTGFAGPIIGHFEQGCLGIGSAFFALSLVIFNAAARNTGDCEAAPRASWTIRKKGFRILPVPRVWNNAIAWKEFHFATGGAPGIMCVAAIVVAAVAVTICIDATSLVPLAINPLHLGASMVVIGVVLLFCQLLYISSVILGAEVQGKTYPILALLPMNKLAMAYKKLLGALAFTSPSIICLVAGLVLLAASAEPDTALSQQAFFLVAGCVSGVGQCVFYYYLTVYFSMKIRFGAFIVAAIVFIIAQVCLGIPAMMVSLFSAAISSTIGKEWGGVGFLIANTFFTAMICGFAVLLIHRMIGRELDVAAGA